MRDHVALPIDYAPPATARPRWSILPLLQWVAAMGAVVIAVYVLWRMHVLTERWIMVYGSDCGTCRRGPSEARAALVLWSVPCGAAVIFSHGATWPLRLSRLALIAVLLSFAFAVAWY
jgi:hypothetical protein